MFDIGWSELLLIGVVMLFAFGPEDIPKIMYNLGRFLRRFRYMRYALSSQFEDFMEKAEASSKPGAKTHSSSQPETLMAPQPKPVETDDEMDADAHLLDLMPPPEHVPDKPVLLDDEKVTAQENNERPATNDTTTPDKLADRG